MSLLVFRSGPALKLLDLDYSLPWLEIGDQNGDSREALDLSLNPALTPGQTSKIPIRLIGILWLGHERINVR